MTAENRRIDGADATWKCSKCGQVVTARSACACTPRGRRGELVEEAADLLVELEGLGQGDHEAFRVASARLRAITKELRADASAT